MTEVSPGIHWIKLPLTMPDVTLAFVNAYLIEGEEGYILVDAGWNTDDTFRALQQQMAEIGRDIRDIYRIVVTHVHPDHYGMAGRIRQISGAQIALHEIEKGYIQSRYADIHSLMEETEKWLAVNGAPPEELNDISEAILGLEDFVVIAFPDIILHGGETFSAGGATFRVLWTPGHSSGHVCLFEPSRKLLISGDHILPTITPNISLYPQSIGDPLGKYINSLKEISKLDIDLVLPGHEEPFRDPGARINEIIGHHEQRNRELLAVMNDGERTAYQIASMATWGVSANWHDLPFFHKRLAVFETLAHLEMMLGDGKLEKLTREGVIYYRQN